MPSLGALPSKLRVTHEFPLSVLGEQLVNHNVKKVETAMYKEQLSFH